MTPPSALPEDAHLTETRVASQELLRGHFLHAMRDTVRLPDGKEATREYVIHPGAVMVVAELPDGRLVLERQFRYPVQSVMVEFPAGKLDPGEFLDVFSASTDELLQWCRDGRITDAKTLTGVLWLQNLRSGAWSLDWASV